ncbi:hypothetical protein Tco_0581501, partial [Tanacetum coccineum]
FAPQLHESAGGLPSLKLSLHSCSLPGSTNAMGIETSIALVLPAREHECDTSFVLGRPPALSVILEYKLSMCCWEQLNDYDEHLYDEDEHGDLTKDPLVSCDDFDIRLCGQFRS